MKPKTESVDNANRKVQLKNATCQTPIQVDVSTLLGKKIDSINDIKLEASVNMSTTTEFEIEFKKANWRYNTVDTDVKKNARKYSMETFDTTANPLREAVHTCTENGKPGCITGQVITVSLKDGENMRKWTGDYALTAKDKIVIEYEAVLNENAAVGSAGNPNDVAAPAHGPTT